MFGIDSTRVLHKTFADASSEQGSNSFYEITTQILFPLHWTAICDLGLRGGNTRPGAEAQGSSTFLKIVQHPFGAHT
jgi:hypothetical protein